jgi:hypothetical protein
MSGRPLSILLRSRAFYPEVGGLERVSQHLARELTNPGHPATVVTDTPFGDANEQRSYRVPLRSAVDLINSLVREADLVLVNGFSVRVEHHCTAASNPLNGTRQDFFRWSAREATGCHRNLGAMDTCTCQTGTRPAIPGPLRMW